MLKDVISSLIFLFAWLAYSQEPYVKLPLAKKEQPTFLLNDSIIVNKDILVVNKEQIEELSVLYDPIDRESQKFYNLTEHGLVFIKLKEKLNTKSQSEINDFFGLDPKSKIYVDGYLLENTDYQIATSSIKEIQVVLPDSENGLDTKVINVWTLGMEDR